MKRGCIFFLFVIIFIIITVFITFFYYPKCRDISCWDAKLEKCSKAKYVNDAPDISWEYKIKGKRAEKCIVSVKVLNVKRGLQKTEILEGKSMDCALPLNTKMSPESDPNLCHGLLKEELQTLIIEKLHQYILSNIGQISGELSSSSPSQLMNGSANLTE